MGVCKLRGHEYNWSVNFWSLSVIVFHVLGFRAFVFVNMFYVSIWTHNLYIPMFWQLFITLCIATNSNAWFGTSVLVTNMRNFPLNRGTVAGILKGYVGISASVYTVIYGVVLKKSPSNLLLFPFQSSIVPCSWDTSFVFGHDVFCPRMYTSFWRRSFGAYPFCLHSSF